MYHICRDDKQNAIETLKNSRASGEDGVVAELVKCGRSAYPAHSIVMLEIIKEIWNMKEFLNAGVKESYAVCL